MHLKQNISPSSNTYPSPLVNIPQQEQRNLIKFLKYPIFPPTITTLNRNIHTLVFCKLLCLVQILIEKQGCPGNHLLCLSITISLQSSYFSCSVRSKTFHRRMLNTVLSAILRPRWCQDNALT